MLRALTGPPGVGDAISGKTEGILGVGGYLSRALDGAAWRDVAGEVVIVEEMGTIVRVLNRTASCIWLLADGTRRVEEIAEIIHERFDVSSEQALADTEEFCRELLEAGIFRLRDRAEAIA